MSPISSRPSFLLFNLHRNPEGKHHYYSISQVGRLKLIKGKFRKEKGKRQNSSRVCCSHSLSPQGSLPLQPSLLLVPSGQAANAEAVLPRGPQASPARNTLVSGSLSSLQFEFLPAPKGSEQDHR